MKLAVYGLGRLGYPLFNVLARARYDVVGIDPKIPDPISRSQRPPHEPGIIWPDPPRMIREAESSDMSFIVVPTPSLDKGDRRGGFDSTYVETALRRIANVNQNGHIAVIVSTVSPGTCERLALAFPSLSIVYNPTFIALGQVVKGLTEPDLLLIGAWTMQPAMAVEVVWKSVFEHFHSAESYPHAHLAPFAEIELIKLSVNAALGTKISLANSLGELFAAWGVDPKAVEVVGRDPRIGSAYFVPGSPITGPCLPRDNKALQAAAAAKGLTLPLSVATDRVNFQLLENLRYRVLTHNPKSVGILGMSYKYGVDVDTDAPGPWLRDALTPSGISVRTYDDLIGHPDGDTLVEVLGADVVVVMHREYRDRLVDLAVIKPVVHLWPS